MYTVFLPDLFNLRHRNVPHHMWLYLEKKTVAFTFAFSVTFSVIYSTMWTVCWILKREVKFDVLVLFANFSLTFTLHILGPFMNCFKIRREALFYSTKSIIRFNLEFFCYPDKKAQTHILIKFPKYNLAFSKYNLASYAKFFSKKLKLKKFDVKWKKNKEN